MVDVYIPEQTFDENLHDQYYDYAKAGTLDVLGATLDETLYYNPANALSRLIEQNLTKGQRGGVLSKEEWQNSGYYREGIEVGDAGIKEGLASILAERHDERAAFNATLSRSRGGFGLGAAQFGVGVVGSFLDPINVASAFIPSVALSRTAVAASRYGPNGNRFVVGAMDGAIGAAIVEPLVIGAAYAEQDQEYGLMDSFLNVAVGSALGGGLHWGAGKISDRINKLPPKTRDEAQRISIGQALLDEESNVTPIIDDAERVNTAKAEDQAGKKVVYDSDGTPKAVDVVDIDKDGTITVRDSEGVVKILDESDLFSKSPYDEDYTISVLGEEDELGSLEINQLHDVLELAKTQLETAESAAADPMLGGELGAGEVAKLKSDIKAIEIEMKRRAGEVIERPADVDMPKEAAAEIARLEAEIKKIETTVVKRQKEQGLDKPRVTAKELSSMQSKYDRIATLKSQVQKAGDLVETEDGVFTVQQKEDAADSASMQADNLGRLSEYKEAVDEMAADKPEMEEPDLAEIEADNNLLAEELSSPEYQSILPADVKSDIAMTADLEAKADQYESFSRVGAACLLRR